MKAYSLFGILILAAILTIAMMAACGDDDDDCDCDDNEDDDDEADDDDLDKDDQGCCYYMCTDGTIGSFDEFEAGATKPLNCSGDNLMLCPKLGVEMAELVEDCYSCGSCTEPEWWEE